MTREKDLNREAERKKTIEALYKAVLDDYAQKRYTPEALERIRGLKSYGPDSKTLERLEKIEAEMRPVIMTKIVQGRGAEGKTPKRPSEEPAAKKKH